MGQVEGVGGVEGGEERLKVVAVRQSREGQIESLLGSGA